MLFRVPLPNQAKQEEQGKTKVCTKCGETKPLGEYYKQKGGKYGVRGDCKVCLSVAKAKYYAANAEKIRSRRAKYRAENPEKVRAAVAKWQAENPERLKASQAKYFRANPDKFRAKCQRYRAKKRNAAGDWSAADWKAKLEYYGYRCRYCGIHKSDTNEGWLEADHAIPLSQGGTNFISNIVPACKSCNCSKGTKTFTEFLDANS